MPAVEKALDNFSYVVRTYFSNDKNKEEEGNTVQDIVKLVIK